MTPEEAWALAQAQIEAEQQKPNNTGLGIEDAARGLGGGIYKGAAELGNNLINAMTPPNPFASFNGPAGEQPAQTVSRMQKTLPHSTLVTRGAEALLPSAQGFQPNTFVGKAMKTGGEFIGGDLPLMGAGGVVRTAISDLAAGTGSEALGEYMHGKKILGHDAEPWYRILGAVLGGVGTAGLPDPQRGTYRAGKIAADRGLPNPGGLVRDTYGSLPAAPNPALASMPKRTNPSAGQSAKDAAALAQVQSGKPLRGWVTPEALQITTDAFYSHLRDLGITYNPITLQNMIVRTKNALERKPFNFSRNQDAVRDAFAQLDTKLNQAASGKFDFSDLDSWSSTMGDLMRQAVKQDNLALSKAYKFVKDQVDDYAVNAVGNLVYNNRSAPLAQKQLLQYRTLARTLAYRNIKQRRLNEIMAAADTYPTGFVSGLQSQIGAELRHSYGRASMWTPNEIKLLKDVTKGNAPLTALGWFGIDPARWGNNRLVTTKDAALGLGAVGVGTGVGMGAISNPLVAAPLAILGGIGTAANVAKPFAKQREMENVGAAIRGGALDPAVAAQEMMQRRRRVRQGLAISNGTALEPDEQPGTIVPGAIRG